MCANISPRVNQQSPPPILGKEIQEVRGDAQSKGACYIKRNAVRQGNEGAQRNTLAFLLLFYFIFFFLNLEQSVETGSPKSEQRN